jgi:hypothetical protein
MIENTVGPATITTEENTSPDIAGIIMVITSARPTEILRLLSK